MSEVDYSSLPAGRELDALVAEKVLGWTPERLARAAEWEESNEDSFDRYGRTYWILETQMDDEGVPFYSTDIAAAWEVVEALLARSGNPQRDIHIEHLHDEWYVSFCHIDEHSDGYCAPTAPLAICRAALALAAAK